MPLPILQENDVVNARLLLQPCIYRASKILFRHPEPGRENLCPANGVLHALVRACTSTGGTHSPYPDGLSGREYKKNSSCFKSKHEDLTGTPNGIRTHVSALRGRRLSRLTNRPYCLIIITEGIRFVKPQFCENTEYFLGIFFKGAYRRRRSDRFR